TMVTEYGRLREVRLHPDGLERETYLGDGGPLYIWSAKPAASVVIAAIDETIGPARAKQQLPEDASKARIGLTTASASRTPSIDSPRLFMDFPHTNNPIEATT